MAEILVGTVALVTGASHGIGAATAKALAVQGSAVARLARRTDRLRELQCAIEATGGTALALVADVRDAAQVSAAVRRTVTELGRLDTVVNSVEGGGGAADRGDGQTATGRRGGCSSLHGHPRAPRRG